MHTDRAAGKATGSVFQRCSTNTRGWQQRKGEQLQNRSRPAGFNLQRGGDGEGAGPGPQQLRHITAPAAAAERPRSPARSYQGHRNAGFFPFCHGLPGFAGSFPPGQAGKVKVCIPTKRFTKIKDGKQSVLCEMVRFSQIHWFYMDTGMHGSCCGNYLPFYANQNKHCPKQPRLTTSPYS